MDMKDGYDVVVCRKCGGDSVRSPSMIKGNRNACLKCRAELQRAARKRLVEAGYKRSEKWLAYFKAYGKRYHKLPHVIERRRAADKIKRLDPKNTVKIKARQALRNAVYSGKIKRSPCEKCGAAKVEGHHEDYTRPLEVRWLCSLCHKHEHLTR